jgi:predicted nuclease of predicted toxin-antitoxin system
MKFLIDVCAGSRDMREILAELGHDAIYAADVDPKASDETLLALSAEQGRILVTEDKDFGDLVFVFGLPHAGIIRFAELDSSEEASAMEYLINNHAAEMQSGAMIVVTPNRIRIRLSESATGGDGSWNPGTE